MTFMVTKFREYFFIIKFQFIQLNSYNRAYKIFYSLQQLSCLIITLLQNSIITKSFNKMKSEEDYEIDIKNNKIKQGFLIKRSRILKQWKQRWMVLTKTHLYSFTQKQVYKKPTQKIPLKDVSTLKSYYKNQYNRPQIIRVQSQDADFYLSAKNHQQKWAWMTAIQKMTDLAVCPQQQSSDTYNLIRQTIRMSSAIRKTISTKPQQMMCQLPKDIFRKMKIMLDSQTVREIIIPTIREEQEEYTSNQSNITIKQQQPIIEKIYIEKEVQKQKIVERQKIVEKQKIVYVPQIKEKIIYVPEIKEVIKTVYVNNPQSTQGNGNLLQFFENVMSLKCQNPRPLIQFIVFLVFSQAELYSQLFLKFAVSQRVQYAFSNAFLQIMNEQIQESKLNNYLKFIIVLYQNNYQYFYSNDLKLLIQILLRQLQMNRSYFNQYLIISVFNTIADKTWFREFKHRREELLTAMNDIKAWTNDPQSKFVVEDLLQKL